MVSLIIYLYMYVVYQAAAKPACQKQHPECDYWKSRDTCVTLQNVFPVLSHLHSVSHPDAQGTVFIYVGGVYNSDIMLM